jgi:hypothetical protein
VATPKAGSPYRLMVEGMDDKHVVIHLLKRKGYDWDAPVAIRPFIEQVEGWTNVVAAIPAAAKTYQRIGIVLDCDVNPADRWKAVSDRFRAVGIDLPQRPSEDGFVANVIPEDLPLRRVGVWLMPDNATAGELEHFLATLVPPQDQTWVHAGRATTEAIAKGASLRSQDEIKGQTFAWLAWQESPGLPFGTAIKARVFRDDSVVASKFVRWFRTLFVD